MEMMVEGWVCKKGWDSRHQNHYHLHWWDGLSSVQGTYSYGGYGVPWQEDAKEVSCGQTTVVFYVRGRNMILFFVCPRGPSRWWEPLLSILPFMSLQPQEILRKVPHLVRGQSVQSSWVGPRHWAHEASQIWQWPCSSTYSPGEQNLVVYLISTWEQPDHSMAVKKTVETVQRDETSNGSATSPKSWPYVVVQLLSHVRLFAILWTAACQASLSFTISQSLLKIMSIESVMPSNHLILSSPSPPAFNLSQHQGLFQSASSLHQVARVLEFQLQHQSFQWIFRTDFL